MSRRPPGRKSPREWTPDPQLPLEIRLEIERVDTLYRQNLPGLLALLLCGGLYAVVTSDVNSRSSLVAWLTVLALSAVARFLLTLRWRKIRSSVTTTVDSGRWLHRLHGLLFVSGALWGSISWQIPFTESDYKRVVTAIVVHWMGQGAGIAYSASLPAMLLVYIPAFLPLMIACFLTGDPTYQMIGVGLVLLIPSGILNGRTYNRYAMSSMRLSVENDLLAHDLGEQVRVKNLALDASGAVTWTWNSETDEFDADGSPLAITPSPQSKWKSSLEGYLVAVHPDDRPEFRSQIKRALASGEEFEIDHRLVSADGSILYHSFRGKKSERGLSGIAWDVTDKKNQEALRRDRQEAEAANRAKSIFLANASHEIRTPLAAINGFADLALQSKETTAEIRRDLEMISRNGKYLISLVNDLLDFSRIESEQFYIQRNQMNVIDEIQDVIATLKPNFTERTLGLDIEYETPVPERIWTDITRFREVLINLLGNSCKFTTRGGVRIGVRFDAFETGTQGLLRLRIVDTGVGISRDVLRHLFQPFARGMDPTVQKIQGSGLGLALSKKLAGLLGGDLFLIHSEPGVGSEFEFSLATGDVASESRILPRDLKRAKRESPPSAPDLRPLGGREILVVDDSPDLYILMKRFLEKQGAKVEVRVNGKEAVERASEKTFDLILMDIKMPVMDGYEAIRALRSVGYRAPVFALTAHASAEDRHRCEVAGFDKYVSKPVDFKSLLGDISSQIENVTVRESSDNFHTL